MGWWERAGCCPSPLAGRSGPASDPREGGGGLWQKGTPEPHARGVQINLPPCRRLGVISTQSGWEKAGQPLLHYMGSMSGALPPARVSCQLVTNLSPGVPLRCTPPTWESVIIHPGNKQVGPCSPRLHIHARWHGPELSLVPMCLWAPRAELPVLGVMRELGVLPPPWAAVSAQLQPQTLPSAEPDKGQAL